MYLHRPEEPSGRRRFLLALSLSTATAVVVAAPLALKAASVDTPIGGADSEVSDFSPSSSSTSTTIPLGPQIGRNTKSSGANLPIGPGDPSDVVTTNPAPVRKTRPTARPTTTAPNSSTSSTNTSQDTTTTTDGSSSTESSTTSSTSSTSTTSTTPTSTTDTTSSDE